MVDLKKGQNFRKLFENPPQENPRSATGYIIRVVDPFVMGVPLLNIAYQNFFSCFIYSIVKNYSYLFIIHLPTFHFYFIKQNFSIFFAHYKIFKKKKCNLLHYDV